MTSTARLWAAFVAGATLVLVAGCTSSTADGPTSTDIASVTVSPSVVDPSTTTSSPSSGVSSSPSAVDSSTPAAVSSDISAQEAADRAAIEAQWVKFWTVYRDMVAMPDSERSDVISTVATSPLSETLLGIARDSEAQGIDNYGTVEHRIFWEFPVDGKTVAAIGDCQDQSASGTFNAATGERSSPGHSRVNIRGQLVKGDDEIWRVQTLVDMGLDNC